MTAQSVEFHINSLVGTTHHYGGLSLGNIASMNHQSTPSSPKKAALEGLDKIQLMASLGIPQIILPPHERPHFLTLRTLGFTGPNRLIPEQVYRVHPTLLSCYSSSSFMWTANAAVMTPSIDSLNNKVHITPANLGSKTHRSIETATTSRLLKTVFSDPLYFHLHSPLPYSSHFNDEGAANHIRFCKKHGEPGVHLFVHGKSAFQQRDSTQFPARQTLEAHQAIARKHQLGKESLVFAQQSSEAIDAGVFHNDVISLGTQNLFIYHEKAFEDTERVIHELVEKVKKTSECPMHLIKVEESQISLKTAVSTYLFNSECIQLPDGAYALIAPIECQRSPLASRYLESLLKDLENPLRDLHYVNLQQSMYNGGGPACLRLRVVLTEKEYNQMDPRFIFTEKLDKRLREWVEAHYRDRLELKDLADPQLVDEGHAALNELTRILDLGSFYDFQK